jgi:hypothetical protein
LIEGGGRIIGGGWITGRNWIIGKFWISGEVDTAKRLFLASSGAEDVDYSLFLSATWSAIVCIMAFAYGDRYILIIDGISGGRKHISQRLEAGIDVILRASFGLHDLCHGFKHLACPLQL